MNLKQKFFGLGVSVSVSLAVLACGNHNPDSIFNPESKSYDSTIANDLSDTAQALKPYLSATCDAKCANDSLRMHTTPVVSSSVNASSGALLSSGIAGSSVVLQSSGTSVAASSSSAMVSLACAADSVLIQVVGGHFKTSNAAQMCGEVSFLYTIDADSITGKCFDHWSAAVNDLQLVGSFTSKEIKVGVIDTSSKAQVLTANFNTCGVSSSTISVSSGSLSSTIVSSSSTQVLSSSSAVVSSSSALVTNFGDTAMTDGRDGSHYKTIKVGSLVWMKQSLQYLPAGSSAPCATITGNTIAASTDPMACATYGRYYSWAEAMNVAAFYNTTAYSGTVSQGVCPAGWRLPTSAELRAVWSSISLDTTSVYQNNGFRGDVINTGLYWTQDVYGTATDKDYCNDKTTSSCGVAWVYHHTADATTNFQYNQGNNKTDGIPVRCVR